jgi:hypothetical protein
MITDDFLIEDDEEYSLSDDELFQPIEEKSITYFYPDKINEIYRIHSRINVKIAYNSISLSLPTDFLPQTISTFFGFRISPVVLNIQITLTPLKWSKYPEVFNISHPVFGSNYIGYPLIQDFKHSFFTSNYSPPSRILSHKIDGSTPKIAINIIRDIGKMSPSFHSLLCAWKST